MTDSVKINGKEYPYLLSYRALKKISTLSTEGKLGIESAEHALYWALFSGWSKAGNNPVEFPFKEKEMEDVLEDNFDLFIKVQKDMQALTDKINGGNEPGK